MARASLYGLEGYLRHAASLDADCRQDPARADAVAQSFVACRTLCHASRTDHVGDPVWGAKLQARIRLLAACAPPRYGRWIAQRNPSFSTDRRRVLCRTDAVLARVRHRRPRQRTAQ